LHSLCMASISSTLLGAVATISCPAFPFLAASISLVNSRPSYSSRLMVIQFQPMYKLQCCLLRNQMLFTKYLTQSWNQSFKHSHYY
jgi:hypothetical protein